MEKLIDIKQLSKGVKFHVIYAEKVISYKFLCVHPDNEQYIIAINNLTKNGDKIYIAELLQTDCWVGDFDAIFFLEKEIEYHKKQIEILKERICVLNK